MPGHQDTTKHVHNLHHEAQKRFAALFYTQEERLNVVLEEYTRHGAIANNMRLFGDGVLVSKDGARGRVDGRDNGQKILEFVEVVGRSGDGAIEGVNEGRVKFAERELRNDVRKVKCYNDISSEYYGGFE